MGDTDSLQVSSPESSRIDLVSFVEELGGHQRQINATTRRFAQEQEERRAYFEQLGREVHLQRQGYIWVEAPGGRRELRKPAPPELALPPGRGKGKGSGKPAAQLPDRVSIGTQTEWQEPPAIVHVTPNGECYHLKLTCRGLQGANSVHNRRRCKSCSYTSLAYVHLPGEETFDPANAPWPGWSESSRHRHGESIRGSQ